MGPVVDVLCALTSLGCAILLVRETHVEVYALRVVAFLIETVTSQRDRPPPSRSADGLRERGRKRDGGDPGCEAPLDAAGARTPVEGAMGAVIAG